ncbi:MAG: hypothetical protein ACLP1E_03910, partial [Acidimicrobiales bacterium]
GSGTNEPERGRKQPPFDLLVRDSELLVTLAEYPIPGGWVAVSDGIVARTGRAGTVVTIT